MRIDGRRLVPDGHAVHRQVVEDEGLGVGSKAHGKLDAPHKDAGVLGTEQQPDAGNPVPVARLEALDI